MLETVLLAALAPVCEPDGAMAIDAARADRRRIATHLAVVEQELRAVDPSGLAPSQRVARARNIDRLHDYWVRGEFPRSSARDGSRVPFFIDADETACAVAHLMIGSGAGDVATEVARVENNAQVAEITTVGVADWIGSSGLTAAECARIQPTYCGCGDDYEPVCGVDGETYVNACVATRCAGVEIAHAGECPPATSTTTDWPPAGTMGDTGTTSAGTETTAADPGSTSSSSGDGSSSGDTTRGDATGDAHTGSGSEGRTSTQEDEPGSVPNPAESGIASRGCDCRANPSPVATLFVWVLVILRVRWRP